MLSSLSAGRSCALRLALLPSTTTTTSRLLATASVALRRGEHRNQEDPSALGGRDTFAAYERASAGSAPHFRRDLKKKEEEGGAKDNMAEGEVFKVKSKEGQKLTEFDVDGVRFMHTLTFIHS